MSVSYQASRNSTSPAASGNPPRSFEIQRLSQIFQSLFEAASDSDAVVRSYVSDALLSLGRNQSQEFMNRAVAFLQSNRKSLKITAKLLLYTAVDQIYQLCSSSTAEGDASAATPTPTPTPAPEIKRQLSGASIVALGGLCIEEMTSSSDEIIVSTAMKLLQTLPEVVIIELLTPYIVPGQLPNLAVLEAAQVIRNPKFIRDVLIRLTPCLGQVKMDRVFIVICDTLRAFADAALDHSTGFGEQDFSAVFDLLVGKWMTGHKEASVRATAAAACGKIFRQLSPTEVEANAQRLILAFMTLLKKDCKKDVDPNVMRGFSDALSAAPILVIEPQLKELIPMLNQMAKQTFDQADMELLRIHYDVLRVFETLCVRMFSDPVLFQLQKNMENPKDKEAPVRLATLSVLRHLSTRNIEPSRIISLLLACKNETHPDVENAIILTILQLGGTGALLLEGGQDLLRHFVLRKGHQSLWLYTSTVESSSTVLWPWILDPIMDSSLEHCVPLMMKCAIHAFNHSGQTEYVKTPNTPPKEALIARALRFKNADFLAIFHSPEKQISEPIWTIPGIARAFIEQRMLSDAGRALNLIEHRQTVALLLESVFIQYYLVGFEEYTGDKALIQAAAAIANAPYSGAVSVHDFAECFGQCAANHLDVVLEKVNGFMKQPKWGKKREDEVARMRCCSIFGSIPKHADPVLFKSRCDSHVMSSLLNMLRTTKVSNELERIEAFRALETVFAHLPDMHMKEDVLVQILSCLKETLKEKEKEKEKEKDKDRDRDGSSSNQNIPIISEGVSAIRALVSIPKPSTKNMKIDIFQQLLPFVPVATAQVESVLVEMLSCEISIAHLYKLLGQVEQSLLKKSTVEYGGRFLVALLKHFAARVVEDPNVIPEEWLKDYGVRIAILMPFCGDPRVVEAMYLLLRMDLFLRSEEQVPDALQKLLASANVSDTSAESALDIAQEVTSILAFALLSHQEEWMNLLTNMPLEAPLALMFTNQFIKARGDLLSPADFDLFARHVVVQTLNSCSEQALPGILHIVRALAKFDPLRIFRMLLEIPDTVHVCKAIQAIAADSGLSDRIMGDICKHLVSVTREDIAVAMTRACKHMFAGDRQTQMRPLVQDHRISLFIALSLRLGIIEFAAAAATPATPAAAGPQAKNDARDALVSFLHCLGLYGVENPCAGGAENMETISELYLERFPDDAESVYEQTFSSLSRLENTGIVVVATGCMAALLRFFCRSANKTQLHASLDMITSLVNALLLKTGMDESLPVKVIALHGLGHISENEEGCNTHATPVLSALLSHADTLSVAGGQPAQPSATSPAASATMNKLLEVQLTALNSMLRIFRKVDGKRIAAVIVNVCLRIRSSFDADDHRIREGAFQVFAILHRFIDVIQHNESFEEQVLVNMPAVLVHFDDPAPTVRSIAKSVFRNLSPAMRSASLVELAKERFLDPEYRLDMTVFATRFATIFVQDLPDRVTRMTNGLLAYLQKSKWPSIRGSSAIVAAGVAAASLQISNDCDVDAVVDNLVKGVAKDAAAEVRSSCARGLGMLSMA
eukprot:ANDGO_01763.mRNA.1 Maestro heat-like repeat-containing protein family member 1